MVNSGLYFILPFIFASVYNNYKHITEVKKEAILTIQSRGLLAAFDSLDKQNHGYIDPELCREVLIQSARILATSSTIAALEELVDELIEEVLAKTRVFSLILTHNLF